ncbi:NAD(P)/FAD-dependent oxidoreductase [Gluconacetobacter asukensis]|uniref:FAD-binding oxidoreductase n=1 Tax=Gluconacetobacter asukensis TaxID=1017181 RepID=A0A7W4IZ39_9PROT|nr:FAD-binding oxidoreductase [Gluconacetobacter asukensis]MBB2171723.1 FAD-binding oxidoreductase [Gluconacetobacter asukensis]
MRNDPRSHGLWELSAPPAPATMALAGDIDADVVIVGAGYTGLSAALHLAAAGGSVVVLEAVEIGFGGSGRNVGLVNAGLWVMPKDVIDGLGPVHGPRILRLLGDAPSMVFDLVGRHGIACEAEHNGTLHCGVGRAGLASLKERERQWRRLGAPVRLLDPGETREKVGSGVYAGALLDARAGTIQPLAYARGLAGAALAAGARIHTASPVVSARQEGGRWRLWTEAGSVRAAKVIVATNAYTTVHAGALWPEIRAELIHLPYFNIATVKLDAAQLGSVLPQKQGAWDTKEVLTSFRLDRAGRLVIGSVGALRGAGLSVHRQWAARALARIYPQLAGIGFESEWFGSIGMTVDDLPRLHRLAENVVSISGYNGRGIAPGTVFGRVLADFVRGVVSEAELPLPVSDVVPARARRVREAVYEYGSAAAHLVGARL